MSSGCWLLQKLVVLFQAGINVFLFSTESTNVYEIHVRLYALLPMFFFLLLTFFETIYFIIITFCCQWTNALQSRQLAGVCASKNGSLS